MHLTATSCGPIVGRGVCKARDGKVEMSRQVLVADIVGDN